MDINSFSLLTHRFYLFPKKTFAGDAQAVGFSIFENFVGDLESRNSSQTNNFEMFFQTSISEFIILETF